MADKFECLPILVVSAKDQNSANIIISEIIGDDSENRTDGDNNAKRVWKLANKYYTADVQFHTILDGQELDTQLADAVEAHLIYLTADECAGGDASELMRSRARGLGAAQVRVAAADAAEPAPGLARAAAAARLELVALREPDAGLPRVRAAFHAHVWPGLVRTPRQPADSRESDLPSAAESEAAESDDEWSDWCAGPGAEDAFAAALAALPGAAAAARALPGERAERLARAENLVAAFCRALGTPLD